MISELFSIGSFSLSPFGPLLVLAFVAAFAQLRNGMKTTELGTEDDAYSILTAAALGGILGGKLYYAILYGDLGLLLNRAGIVYYGGLIGGAIAVLATTTFRGMPFWKVIDVTAPSVAIGYAVGRVGCLVVGDDYGVPSDVPWAMAFPEGPIPTTAGAMRQHFDVDIAESVPADTVLKVHPTQLYEVLLGTLIWFLGRSLLRQRSRPAGVVGLTVLAMLAVERFGIEFLRAKDDRLLGVLTVAQGISIVIFAVCLLGLLARSRSDDEA
ncbi:MAG: prolipoprotein diacylglyceryl transferase family protein [Acidobacteriota bacterium]